MYLFRGVCVTLGASPQNSVGPTVNKGVLLAILNLRFISFKISWWFVRFGVEKASADVRHHL